MKKEKLQAWEEARKKHGLSFETIKMAQRLGLNPKKLGKIDKHKQEPWKAPLSVFIQKLYEKQQSKIAARQVKAHAQQSTLSPDA